MPCRQDAPVWGAASSTCARTYAPAEGIGTPPSCHRNTRPAGIGKWEMAKLGNCCTAVRFPFGVRGEEKKNTHIFQTARCRWPREASERKGNTDRERERDRNREIFLLFEFFLGAIFFSARLRLSSRRDRERRRDSTRLCSLSVAHFYFSFLLFFFFFCFLFSLPCVCFPPSLEPQWKNGKFFLWLLLRRQWWLLDIHTYISAHRHMYTEIPAPLAPLKMCVRV